MSCEHSDKKITYEVHSENNKDIFRFDNLTDADSKFSHMHKSDESYRLCQIDTCNMCADEIRVCIKGFLA